MRDNADDPRDAREFGRPLIPLQKGHKMHWVLIVAAAVLFVGAGIAQTYFTVGPGGKRRKK